MRRKNLVLIISIICCLIILCACKSTETNNESANVDNTEEIVTDVAGNILVYRTYADGRPIDDTPSNIFLNDSIVKEITKGTGIGPIKDADPGIIFIMKYPTTNGHNAELFISRNGSVSKMIDGLNYDILYFTEPELKAFIEKLT